MWGVKPLDRIIEFGKYRNATWRQVLDHGDYGYLWWVATLADHRSIDDELRDALTDAIEDEVGQAFDEYLERQLNADMGFDWFDLID